MFVGTFIPTKLLMVLYALGTPPSWADCRLAKTAPSTNFLYALSRNFFDLATVAALSALLAAPEVCADTMDHMAAASWSLSSGKRAESDEPRSLEREKKIAHRMKHNTHGNENVAFCNRFTEKLAWSKGTVHIVAG